MAKVSMQKSTIFVDASWDRFWDEILNDFWDKMIASRHQNLIKNRW